MSNKDFCKMYCIVYETGTSGCALYYSDKVEKCLELIDTYIDILKERIQLISDAYNSEEIPYEFFVPKIDLPDGFYDIKSHENHIIDPVLSHFGRDFSLYILEVEEDYNPAQLPRLGNHIFYDKMKIIDYTVLYETGQTGCFLGKFSNYHEADLLFDKIVKDLSQTIQNQSVQNTFFEMYAVFQIPTLCMEYHRYKIANHKNQILEPKMIWSTPDYCLYIVKTCNGFNVNKLKRTQNHFFHEESKYFEGQINLIMN